MRWIVAIVSMLLAVSAPALAQTILGSSECACERAVAADGCCPGEAAPPCDADHEQHDDDAPHGCPPLCHDCACAAYATITAPLPAPGPAWSVPRPDAFPSMITTPPDPPRDGVFHPPR